MFEKLKHKWKVGNNQLFLIFCVFALTGTATAYFTRQVTTWSQLEAYSAGFWMLKIFVLTFGYQLLLLIVSLPFGQFPFFWNLEKKIMHRIIELFRSRKQ